MEQDLSKTVMAVFIIGLVFLSAATMAMFLNSFRTSIDLTSNSSSQDFVYTAPTTLESLATYESITSSEVKAYNQTWLNFDGVNDYVDMDNIAMSGGYTINFFMKPLNSSVRTRPLSIENWMMFYFNSDSRDSTWYLGNGTALNGGDSFVDFIDYDEWQMVTITYNGTNGNLYKNGILVDTNTHTGLTNTKQIFHIGANANPLDGFFNGSINSVTVLNNSIESNQVLRYYNESLLGSNNGKGIPILLYHIVSNSPSLNCTNNLYAVCEENFTEQIQYLYNNNFTSITYEDYFNYIQGTFSLPKKPIIITFDDIHNSTCNFAEDTLDTYGFVAVQNIITNSVGTSDRCSWSDLDRQLSKGWEMGSHSINGTNMLQLSPTVIQQVMNESKNAIESNLSTTVIQFQYPQNQRNLTSDNICAGIYNICSGNATNYPTAKYAYINSNLTHEGTDTMFRINVENLTTISAFINNLNYMDSKLVQLELNENNGTTAYDSSGNANHGNISGATWTTDGVLNTLTAIVDYTIDTTTGLFTIVNTDYSWNWLNVSWDYTGISDSTGYNSMGTIRTGLATFADWIALIVITIAAAIVLGVILSSFRGGNNRI